MKWLRVGTLVLLLSATASAAFAQDPYVGASLVGDIGRFSQADVASALADVIGDYSAPSRDGEALGFLVVAGTPLGERWGVEVEFVRPQAVKRTATIDTIVPLRSPVPAGPGLSIPNYHFTLDAQERHTTITAAAWVRQELGDRFELAYSGGVTFLRTDLHQELSLPTTLLALFRPFTVPDLVEYGVGPAVGVEGRWRLLDHVAVVPGVRLHAVHAGGAGGWLLRPSIGARWVF